MVLSKATFWMFTILGNKVATIMHYISYDAVAFYHKRCTFPENVFKICALKIKLPLNKHFNSLSTFLLSFSNTRGFSRNDNDSIYVNKNCSLQQRKWHFTYHWTKWICNRQNHNDTISKRCCDQPHGLHNGLHTLRRLQWSKKFLSLILKNTT